MASPSGQRIHTRDDDYGVVEDSRSASVDADGFEAFYRQQRPALSAAFYRLSDDTRYVDDAVQEALIIARRRWHHISAYDSPQAWVAKVTRRLLLRWQHHDRQRLDRLDALHATVVNDVHPHEPHDDVLQAVAALPPRQREVIVLHYFLDLAVRDVADVLGRAEGTVKVQLSTAREKLRTTLEEGGSDDAR